MNNSASLFPRALDITDDVDVASCWSLLQRHFQRSRYASLDLAAFRDYVSILQRNGGVVFICGRPAIATCHSRVVTLRKPGLSVRAAQLGAMCVDYSHRGLGLGIRLHHALRDRHLSRGELHTLLFAVADGPGYQHGIRSGCVELARWTKRVITVSVLDSRPGCCFDMQELPAAGVGWSVAMSAVELDELAGIGYYGSALETWRTDTGLALIADCSNNVPVCLGQLQRFDDLVCLTPLLPGDCRHARTTTRNCLTESDQIADVRNPITVAALCDPSLRSAIGAQCEPIPRGATF